MHGTKLASEIGDDRRQRGGSVIFEGFEADKLADLAAEVIGGGVAEGIGVVVAEVVDGITVEEVAEVIDEIVGEVIVKELRARRGRRGESKREH